MALNKHKLGNDLKDDQDLIQKLTKNGEFKKSSDSYTELGKRFADSIEDYIKGGDVLGVHTITNLMIEPGATTLEMGETAIMIPGQTLTQGAAQPGSNIGPFGKEAYPGAKGKII
jgi:hypothetical protein